MYIYIIHPYIYTCVHKAARRCQAAKVPAATPKARLPQAAATYE